MAIFTVRVLHTDKLNENNYYYFEKGELFVGVTGQLYGFGSCVCLELQDLAEKYSKAITARRRNDGDKDFESVVEKISGGSFDNKVKAHSEKVRAKLERWGNSKPKESNTTQGWLILIKHGEHKEKFYLRSFGKRIQMSNKKSEAKIYKRRAFALNTVDKINKMPQCQALAIEVN